MVDNLPQHTSPENETPTEDAFSVFTKPTKHLIVFLASIAGFFSLFSASIYFPALTSIAASLGVSLELMNITVTTYLLVQGVAPSFYGDLSDNVGRRPAYLLLFLIYFLANIGLSLQDSYPALLILRMLQSAGISATIALSYGMIADIAPPHERGGYVGIAYVGFNSANSLGPVLGGLLTIQLGWRAIFWFLSFLSGVVLIALVVFLPETNRKLVGNGRIQATGLNRSLTDHVRHRRMPMSSHKMTKPQFRIPNLLPSLRLIFRRDTAILLFTNAIVYMKYACVQSSLAPLLQHRYGLTVIEVGFCYLAFGSSTAIASYGVGKIADYDYRKAAQAHGINIDQVKGDVLSEFPLEEARLRTVWLYIFTSASATLVYGWSLEHHTNIALPLGMQFLIGLGVTGVFNVCNTLVVDLHPGKAVTASATVSITRCFLAAAGVSVMQILFESIRPGWTFTIFAGLCYSTSAILLLERKRGWQWRQERPKTHDHQ